MVSKEVGLALWSSSKNGLGSRSFHLDMSPSTIIMAGRASGKPKSQEASLLHEMAGRDLNGGEVRPRGARKADGSEGDMILDKVGGQVRSGQVRVMI